jgi:type IV secretory pathway VirB4 component
MSQTNTKAKEQIFGQSKELIQDMTDIIEGHIIINRTRPVAVYKLTPTVNPDTLDTHAVQSIILMYQSALNAFAPGEKLQIIVKTKSYDLAKRMSLYDSMAFSAREEKQKELNKAIVDKDTTAVEKLNNILSDNYIKNKYPPYLKGWLNEFVTINNVYDYEYYLLYAFDRASLQDMTSGETDPVKIMIKNKNFLDTNKSAFVSNMRIFGNLKQLEKEEIIHLVEDCVNDNAGNISTAYANSNTIARTAMERNNDYLKIGDKFCQTVYVSDLPPGSMAGFLKTLQYMHRPYRLSLIFEGINQDTVKKRLERELKVANSQASGFIKNYAAEDLIKKYDNLLQRKAAGQVSFLKFGLYITLMENSRQDLIDSVAFVKQMFSDVPFFKGTYEQIKDFKSTLPFCINYGGHSYTISTDDAISTFLFFTFDSSTTEGGAFLGCNKLHQPVYYYPWSEDFSNGNMCIMGIPGSGKSFSINTILANLGAWGHDVFIVDKSKSYEFLCNMQGGQYLTLDLEGKYSVNIFDCADYDKDLIDATSNDNDINKDGTVTANKIAQIVGFFKTVLCSRSASDWQLERSLIETAIGQTYEEKMKVNAEGKIDPKTVPTLSDFHKMFSKLEKSKPNWEKQIQEIAEKLNSYVGKGQYSKFVDRQTNIDLTSGFIVFDTSGLPEDVDLQSLAVYIISTFLTKKFKANKKRGKKQLLMVDETWTLARFEAGVTFLLNLSKRSRHMGLVCAFATQQMADFFANPDAAQLFKNVENFILFKQSDADLDNLRKNLELNEQERALIANLDQVKGEYSDAFVKMGKLGSNVVKIRPNPPLNWIATTNKTDAPIKARVLKEENYNYEKAIERLVAGGY